MGIDICVLEHTDDVRRRNAERPEGCSKKTEAKFTPWNENCAKEGFREIYVIMQARGVALLKKVSGADEWSLDTSSWIMDSFNEW